MRVLERYEMNIVKVCKIHGELTRDLVTTYGTKRPGQYRCKKCLSEKSKEYQKKIGRDIRQELPKDWLEREFVKECKRHGKLTPNEAIYINDLNIRCKECSRLQTNRTYEKHKEKYNEKARNKRKNDPVFRSEINERDRLYQAKRYLENKDHVLALSKRWREENPEKQRNLVFKTRYGITAQEYDQLLELQKGVCAICKEPETTLNKKKEIKKLSVDHCHDSKNIRGLLCVKCNCMIGYARDSIKILGYGIKYLRNNDNGSAKCVTTDN